jgi:NAD(P)H-nitrite reductase large subunit
MYERLKAHYVIIGAGPAGIAAAEAIRKVDSDKGILIINGEDVPPYCRPLIVDVLKGERAFDDIHLRPKEWFTERNISLLNGDCATKLIIDKKHIELESGRTVEWQKLLIATGSKPSQPRIDGLSDVPVYTMFRFDDIERLKPLIKPGAKALLLGLGLIGLQAMMALRELGVEITAVELMPKVLPLILDLKAARYVQYRLEDHGIDVRVQATIEKLIRSDGAKYPFTAVMSDGDRIGFDFLILATGMRPESALLDGSGIEIDRGVKVSPLMETNIPDIYAAGDVTEYSDWIEGRSEIHAHWINASHQGRIAGFSMAGKYIEAYEPIYINSLNIFGLPIITMGASRIDHFENAKVYVSDSPLRPAYSRLAIRNGIPVAATFINDVERAGVFQYLIREKVNIGEIAKSLFNSELDGMEFIYKLHDKAIKGDIDWPESMYAIEFYKKDQDHTQWGKKEDGK